MVAETKLYDALGIRPDASQDEIKKAYKCVFPILPSSVDPVLTRSIGKPH